MQESVNIPIGVIQGCVSEATGVELNYMLCVDGYPEARKREYVVARQISMFFSREFNGKSLKVIGENHGKRDHATVVHAIKTINNLIDIKDHGVMDLLRKSKEYLEVEIQKVSINKPNLIKIWIKNKVPLHIRQELLQNNGRLCRHCGHVEPIKLK